MAEPLYTTIEWIARPALRVAMRHSISGLEHVPRSGGLLVAINHISYLDPFTAGYALVRVGRRPRFLAKRELFEDRRVGWIMRRTGQIPVDRGTSRALDSLVSAREALVRGEAVVIMPEGTISTTWVPMRPRSGVGRLAVETGVPVLPVGLWGAHRVLTKGRKPNWKLGVVSAVEIGEALRFPPDADPRQAAKAVMGRIVDLVSAARARYPQAPSGPDDDWWTVPDWEVALKERSFGESEPGDPSP